MYSISVILIYLIVYSSQLASVLCDGDHAHDHSHAHEPSDAAAAGAATSTQTTSSGPAGSVTTIHTTSGDDGGASNSAFAGILSSISPDLINSLSRNPQVAQYLKSSGIDVGTVTASRAAAAAGGKVAPAPAASGGAYDYPPPPAGGGLGGLGGFGGAPFPFFGPYKQLHISSDFGASYYPFVEKAVIIVGGGILILVILAILSKAFAKGGLFYDWGTSFSNALAGSASVDIGPFHKSVAGAGSVSAGVGNGGIASTPGNVLLTQQVYDGLDRRF